MLAGYLQSCRATQSSGQGPCTLCCKACPGLITLAMGCTWCVCAMYRVCDPRMYMRLFAWLCLYSLQQCLYPEPCRHCDQARCAWNPHPGAVAASRHSRPRPLQQPVVC